MDPALAAALAAAIVLVIIAVRHLVKPHGPPPPPLRPTSRLWPVASLAYNDSTVPRSIPNRLVVNIVGVVPKNAAGHRATLRLCSGLGGSLIPFRDLPLVVTAVSTASGIASASTVYLSPAEGVAPPDAVEHQELRERCYLEIVALG